MKIGNIHCIVQMPFRFSTVMNLVVVKKTYYSSYHLRTRISLRNGHGLQKFNKTLNNRDNIRKHYLYCTFGSRGNIRSFKVTKKRIWVDDQTKEKIATA